ncbi:MAG: 8-amino-7-oxononanoate synthase [Planctomycetia bacterium]|nr:8-amino-7-oxononanoate synthase [Planctomycetia bacterium]
MPPPSEHQLTWIDDELSALAALDLRRRLTSHRGPQGPYAEIAGRPVIHFGANDYLGLAGEPRLAAAAREAIDREGWGSGASPLLAGRGAAHERLETELAQFEGTEAALVFSSGFAANLAAVSALVSRGDTVLADEMNHASLVDGCRLSRAKVEVYPHRDTAALGAMLAASKDARRRLIVTDALFSMDGDLAPLVDLADLAERYRAMLLVDEAHATGVFGENGRGVAEQLGVADRVDVRVGTLSKALGGVGGFVCGRASLIEWLVNRARPYMFSTAPPAAVCAAASAALGVVRTEPERRRGLLHRAAQLRGALAAQGWDVGRSASQIIPIVVREPAAAVELSRQLFERGLYVPAIRPPSVPAGGSRLRISLAAGHDAEMIAAVQAALKELAPVAACAKT